MKKITINTLYKMDEDDLVNSHSAAALLNVGRSTLSTFTDKGYRLSIVQQEKGKKISYRAGDLRNAIEHGVLKVSTKEYGWFVRSNKKSMFTTEKPETLQTYKSRAMVSTKPKPVAKSPNSLPDIESLGSLIVTDPETLQTWKFGDVMFEVLGRMMDIKQEK